MKKELAIEKKLLSLYIKKEYVKCFEYAKECAAKYGSPSSYHYIGLCYFDGLGVSKYESAGFDNFLTASEKGYVPSMLVVAGIFYDGKFVTQDVEKACFWYKQAAKRGSREGHFKYALFFDQDINGMKDKKKAIEEYEKAAEMGHDLAMYRLGELYLEKGEEHDLAKAVKWLTPAASKGDTKAQAILAKAYYDGVEIPQDNQKAFTYYLALADKGYLEAQEKVGYFYQNGIGVERNYTQAKEYYLMAANQGSSFANCNIGNMYLKGLGVNIDNREAFERFMLGCDKFDKVSEYNAGNCYFFGIGVKENKGYAIEYYKKSASKGYPDAEYALATCYYKGEGTPANVNLAFKYFDLSYPKMKNAALYLAKCYESGQGTQEDHILAVSYYKKAAAANNVEACYHLSHLFTDNIYPDILYNEKEGLKYLGQAASLKDKRANYELGYYSEFGYLGLKRDYKQAIAYYLKATEDDYAKAFTRLAYMNKDGKGCKKDINKAIDYLSYAAELHDIEARCEIAYMVFYGMYGYTKDENEAVRQLVKLANRKYPKAMLYLGHVLLEEGNYPESKVWLDLAYKAGQEKAKADLKKVNHRLRYYNLASKS